MRLSDYITTPREERMGHIDLTSPCDLSGSWKSRKWKGREALLAFLSLENDVDNWAKAKIQCCHHCDENSTRGWCRNPLHISLGTVIENHSDKSLEARLAGPRKSVEYRRNHKVPRRYFGSSHTLEKRQQSGKTTGAQKWMSLHDGYISVPGGVARHNEKLGVDKNYKVQLAPEEVAFIFLWAV